MAPSALPHCKVNMSRLTRATLALLFPLLLAASTHQPYMIPTPEDLSDALTAARAAWGVEVSTPIRLRLEPLNPCRIGPWGNPRIAVTQMLDTAAVIRFDNATEHPDAEATRVWVIRLNSNCDWRRLPLENTIIHEYGTILLGTHYHTDNPLSVMYWMVTGEQFITPEDKDAVDRLASFNVK